MKCPQCVEEGERSTLHFEYSSTTCMAGQSYYDEGGDWHDHDPNKSSAIYHCSRDHSLAVSSTQPCDSCDYGHTEPVVKVVLGA